MDPGTRYEVGRTGLTVTQMGFGGAPLGNLFSAVSHEEAISALNAAYEAGLRYFDTAPLYGHGLSETRVGAVLQDYPRESYVLSTKVGRLLAPSNQSGVDGGDYVDVLPNDVVYDYSYDGTMRSVQESLDRLGIGSIDILYIHDIDVMTHGSDQPRRYGEAMEGAFPALERLREDGTVKAIGLGVNEWTVCERSLQDADFDCFLLAGQYSLLKQEALESFLPACERRGVSVVIGGPYNSGILASGAVEGAKYFYKPAPPEILERTRRLEEVCARHEVPLAAAALQFPLLHPAVVSVIPGARSLAELEQNIGFLRRSAPPALWADLKSEGLIRQEAPTSDGSHLKVTEAPGASA